MKDAKLSEVTGFLLTVKFAKHCKIDFVKDSHSDTCKTKTNYFQMTLFVPGAIFRKKNVAVVIELQGRQPKSDTNVDPEAEQVPLKFVDQPVYYYREAEDNPPAPVYEPEPSHHRRHHKTYRHHHPVVLST